MTSQEQEDRDERPEEGRKMEPVPPQLENAIRMWDKLRSELSENHGEQRVLSNREQNIRKKLKEFENEVGKHIGRNKPTRFIMLGDRLFEVSRVPGDNSVCIEVHEVEGPSVT